jgi:hypothetical protein
VADAEPELVFEPLTVANGVPTTVSGMIGVTMLVKPSGSNNESQWFDFRATVFSDVVSYMWSADTKLAVFPAETANLLIKNGYARLMNEFEVKGYNIGPLGIPEFLQRSPDKETKS